LRSWRLILHLPSREELAIVLIKHHRSYSTLFPYTTLFRSRRPAPAARDRRRREPAGRRPTAARPRPECRQASGRTTPAAACPGRSEEHTSELQSRENLVCRLLLEKKNR